MDLLKEQLKGRSERLPETGCFLCRWILQDLEKHGRLTDVWPEKNHDGSVLFPATGKVAHLKLEGFWNQELQALAA
jgi:hypothetical protein